MIDFWEVAGRFLLMDPGIRNKEIYDAKSGILPLQADGSILQGHANKATLPFPVKAYYDQLRDYIGAKYTGGNNLLSPVVSMFALGEVGVMFFTQPFRDAFEDVSSYLLSQSPVKGRSDKGSDSIFYIVLALLVIDSTTRGRVAQGEFLGLKPANQADQGALMALANDQTFVKKANHLCFEEDWIDGSDNTLRDQSYPPAKKDAIPFRHFRFVSGLS